MSDERPVLTPGLRDEITRRLIAKGVWCEPDECPASICGGPHVQTTDDSGNVIISPVSS